MKDDNLNDTHVTRPGGYCPMCDTVYDRPHKCVGKTTRYCSECECEPCQCVGKCECDVGMCTHSAVKTYRLVNVDKALETNVFERRIWNEAIEAAALKAEQDAREIRKLKK